MRVDQSPQGPFYRLPLVTPKMAKVIRVHPAAQSVDIAFLNGTYAENVPVPFGLATSVSGLVNIAGPTVRSSQPSAPTYVQDTSSESDTPSDPTDNGQLRQPEDVLNGELRGNRDIYALVTQVEGIPLGTSGFVVLGFFRDTNRNEMMFPADLLLTEFDDFLLYRHESDVQITIDKTGATSIQHPSGARITIAEKYATDDLADPKVDGVDLTGKDFNGFYKIRNNTTRKAAVIIRDATDTQVLMDGLGNFEATNTAGVGIAMNADGSAEIHDANDNNVKLDTNGMALTSKGKVHVTAKNIDAEVELTANIVAQTVNVEATEIGIKADSVITISAPLVAVTH